MEGIIKEKVRALYPQILDVVEVNRITIQLGILINHQYKMRPLNNKIHIIQRFLKPIQLLIQVKTTVATTQSQT